MDGWLRRWTAPDLPRTRLLVLPPAGGAAHLFRPWARLVPPGVELLAVEWPGHGTRLAEPPLTDLDALLDALVARLRRLTPVPMAVLGHSMGAIAALALCHRLRELDPRWRPVALFVVGSEGPDSRRSAGDLAAADDAELRRFITGTHAGNPTGATDPALQDLVLPALRADLSALAAFRPPPRPPLPAPVRVFCGAGDPFVGEADRQGWAACGDRGFAVHLFPGGHFFYEDEEVAAAMFSLIRRDLQDTTAPAVAR